MAATKNIDKNPLNSDYEEEILLDEPILISNNIGHMSISHGDMLIYVHGEATCHNICKITPGTNYENAKECLRQKTIAKIEAKGGKPCAC